MTSPAWTYSIPARADFVFAPGPVFANVLLADEINRTTPKVQSALLEVMAEGQVTVGNTTYRMDPFFFVIATQNPVEMEGVYPLPLAQIDRFLMKLHIGYPEPGGRGGDRAGRPLGDRDAGGAARLRQGGDPGRARARGRASTATRSSCGPPWACPRPRGRIRGIALGASPRGSLMLVRAARAFALVRGREYVIDQDLIDLAPLVIAHRLRLKDARTDADALVREIVMSELARISY